MRRTALISSCFLGRVLAAGHLLAGAILGAALAPGQAYADCPATYAGLSCGALAPVCAVSSTTWTCNVTAGASTAWITSDSDATTQYEAYGTHNGTAFCCTVPTGTTINHIILNGSGAADSLRFYDFTNGGGTPYNLIETSGTTLDGNIFAGAANDAVDGSQRVSANYSEVLYGQDAVDTIHGGDGDDTCDVAPRNADEIPLLDPVAATETAIAQARESAASSFWPLSHRISSLTALAIAPELAAWVAESRNPGRGWEALQPTHRRWLQLLARMDPLRLDALLRGAASYDIPASTVAPDLDTLFPDDRVEAGSTLRLTRRLTWLPLPAYVLRAQYSIDSGFVDGPSFGFPPAAVRLLIGRRVRDWQGAAPLYASWRTLSPCAVSTHASPAIPEAEAQTIAENICTQAVVIARWLGHPTAHCDIFVYADGERQDVGLPPWDFALPRFAQVHQGEHSTRGHELAHVLLFDAWGQEGSAAAGEGIATLLNGDYSAVGRAQSALPESFDFATIAGDFPYDDDGYYGGAVMAAFANDRFGATGARELYQAHDAVQAIAALAGVTPDEVNPLLHAWLRNTR